MDKDFTTEEIVRECLDLINNENKNFFNYEVVYEYWDRYIIGDDIIQLEEGYELDESLLAVRDFDNNKIKKYVNELSERYVFFDFAYEPNLINVGKFIKYKENVGEL